MNGRENFPALAKGECAVLLCELDTGVVLSVAGGRARRDDAIYRVFPTIEAGLAFGRKAVAENPLNEASVLDSEGVLVQRICDLEEARRQREADQRSGWWNVLLRKWRSWRVCR